VFPEFQTVSESFGALAGLTRTSGLDRSCLFAAVMEHIVLIGSERIGGCFTTALL
jgi:hypothetical protein